MILFDGHVHTPYCPHGSNDSLEAYIERGITLGLKGLTFTEHAPLPNGFTDPVPAQDSAMPLEQLDNYIDDVTRLKKKYANKFEIKLGLEVDYIEGFEQETAQFLQKVGPYLDDAILSVHFLKRGENYYCIDFSPEQFKEIANVFGSVDHVHKAYYNTVAKSIVSNLGKYKPKRIGHMTLVNKFQKKHPPTQNYREEQIQLLTLIDQYRLQLDYNSAGVVKPFCQETYPPSELIDIAIAKKIPLVYGSDAHSIKGLLQGAEHIEKDSLVVPS